MAQDRKMVPGVNSKLKQWGYPLAAWAAFLAFVFFFPEAHYDIPTPLIVAIPVVITGSTLGIFGGIVSGLIGLPMTLLAHETFHSDGSNLSLARLVISTLAYCLIGGIGGNLYDLRKRLDRELEKSRGEIQLREEIQTALAESEKNYRTLFELESDAIFIVQNQDGQILEANSAACSLYGYSHEELLSKKNTDISAEPEQTRAATRATAPLDKVVRIPLRYHRKKDGTVFPVEITARFIVWKDRSVHIAAIRDITERRKIEQELERLATTDPLTGLANRRQFFHQAGEIFTRARHYPYRLSILMLDLDHFKEVNDNFGHATGDAALREVARRLRENIRPTDILGRYGGEEFTVVLPRTDLAEARQIASRLCEAIADKPIMVDAVNVRVTVSMGVAGLDENVTSLDELLTRADQSLYAAKEAGRNRWAEWRPARKP
jgi:diguanylate cyclase (GGDEF)-like protein/PAS domain S-box-containing protein